MNFTERAFADGEDILMTFPPHWSSKIGSTLFIVISLLMIAFGVTAFIFDKGDGFTGFMIFGGGGGALFLLSFLRKLKVKSYEQNTSQI